MNTAMRAAFAHRISARRRPTLLRIVFSTLMPLISALWFARLSLPACAAGTLPTGGHFAAGTGSIGANGATLTIKQTSGRGVIDWTSFSIGSGARVAIDNGAGATLNRVTGSSASTILGTLSATGSVYLINPQGIVVGPSGVIATGGRFVGSTLDVANAAFMQGAPLTLSGNSSASIVNLGRIGSSGGDVFLIARNEVIDAGRVDAPNGTAEFAVGEQVLLQDSSSSKQVFVQSGSGGSIMTTGTIAAAQVSLQAADGNVYALAGNHQAIRATGTATRDGHVWLVATQGTVALDGNITAVDAGGSGGIVDTTARRFSLCSCDTAPVVAHQWNISAPGLSVDGRTARALGRSLNAGTSIDLRTSGSADSSGDIAIASDIQWQGAASLSLLAYRNVSIAAGKTIRNHGNGNLTLRADATGLDNGGSVFNEGTLDWSASTGTVSALYDLTGTYAPGSVLANPAWSAAPASGLLTQATAYRLINSLSDLQNMSLDLGGVYALGKDIAAGGASFTPLGNTATPFVGQFDGMGHTIDQISPQQTALWQPTGLFGVIGKAGVVRNVGVTGSNVGYDDGAAGMLAGNNQGLVTRAWATGTIYSSNEDQTITGGLVGQNDGVIERSSSSASSNTQGLAGGLVGLNNGTIAQSYSTGDVTGALHVRPGGLVGDNQGTITQSYATGSTSGYAGGAALVWSNEGTIAQSFATGKVNQFGNQGAGIAYTNTGTIAPDVYWDKDTTGQSMGQAQGSGGLPAANGLTAAQMRDPESFVSWSFGPNGTWAMPAGAAHPVLNWQLGP